MSLDEQNAVLFGSGDELPSNHCANPHMSELIDQRRRGEIPGRVGEAGEHPVVDR